MISPHALFAWGSEVAWDDTLDASCLRGAYDALLLIDEPSDHSADEDVDSSENLHEPFDAVIDIAEAYLNTGAANRLRSRFGDGLRTHKCRNALGWEDGVSTLPKSTKKMH